MTCFLRRSHITLLAVLAGMVVSTGQVAPQDFEARDRHLARLQCLACHAGPNRIVTDPVTGETRSVTIEMSRFRNADHGKLECLECHEKGFEQYPHVNMDTNVCMDCHPRKEKGASDDKPYEFDRMEREFHETVHFKEYKHKKPKCCGLAPKGHVIIDSEADKKDNQLFTCEHCHDPHYFEATKRIKLPLRIQSNDNGPCLRCHKADATGKLADPAKPSLVAVHKYLSFAEEHLTSTRCIDCHTTVTKTVAHDLPEGMKADQGCNSCHSIDTVLKKRLYRFVESKKEFGFENSDLLQNSYVMGANRNYWSDWITVISIALVAALLGLHAMLRLYFPRHRNKRPSDPSNESNGEQL